MKPFEELRVAVVHEWLVQYAGSERAVAAILEAFRRADLHALVHDPEGLSGTPLEQVPVQTSFIQSLPKAKESTNLSTAYAIGCRAVRSTKL